MGRLDEAGVVLVDALERFGDGFQSWLSLTLNDFREFHPELRAHLIDGRKAGLIT